MGDRSGSSVFDGERVSSRTWIHQHLMGFAVTDENGVGSIWIYNHLGISMVNHLRVSAVMIDDCFVGIRTYQYRMSPIGINYDLVITIIMNHRMRSIRVNNHRLCIQARTKQR